MSNAFTYCLYSDEVPEPAEGLLWFNTLRWLMAVMNNDDTSLGFAAGCLSYLAREGGLTDRQAQACKKIKKRVLYDYQAGVLDCQLNEPNPCDTHCETDVGLEEMEPEGEA